jgi:hypothetical protein
MLPSLSMHLIWAKIKCVIQENMHCSPSEWRNGNIKESSKKHIEKALLVNWSTKVTLIHHTCMLHSPKVQKRFFFHYHVKIKRNQKVWKTAGKGKTTTLKNQWFELDMKEHIRQLKIQRKKREPNIQSSAMVLFVNHIAPFYISL